ncbi:MAG TPA: ABC transporter permease [Phototrophicaceae bacterium]|nr:ABC transporter permease [Phototrophicaceae bacterium]
MNSLTYPIVDSVTMLRRTLAHMLSNPVVTILTTIGTPVILLVLMYNLFGGVIQANSATSGSYINYLTPGMILITGIYSTGWAALRINADMTQGIIARFRSMSISRSAVLNGHVIGSTLGTLTSITVVLGLAYLMGFRSAATPVELLAALGLILLYVTAIMWLAIAVGVWGKSPDAVNGVLYLVYILPFFSSAFVPTTSMTPVVAWIATNQPFTPIIDTLRALLTGAPLGDRAVVALAWCLGIGLVGFIWSRIAYNRSTKI